jgi:hypothetical protein
MIVFGGRTVCDGNQASDLADVWKYSLLNHTWTQLTSSNGPRPRAIVASIYDGHGRMITYEGGDEVWSYSIANQVWTRLPSANGPSTGYGFSAIYDGAGNMAVFGGKDGNDVDLGGVWEYRLPEE